MKCFHNDTEVVFNIAISWFIPRQKLCSVFIVEQTANEAMNTIWDDFDRRPYSFCYSSQAWVDICKGLILWHEWIDQYT